MDKLIFFFHLGLDDGLIEGFGPDSMYGDEAMDVENPPSDKGDAGTGLGKGKLLSIHSAKKRFGANRPKFTYQKMKVAEMGKKRGMKSKMRGVFGVPGLGLQVNVLYIFSFTRSSSMKRGFPYKWSSVQLRLCATKMILNFFLAFRNFF